jgi:guanidinopropionase
MPSAKKAKADLQPVNSSVVPRYAEVATFLRAPRSDDLDAVDIGIFGVPTDLGLSNRTGTRHGPSAVREGSRLIRRFNQSTGLSPFAAANIADLGDVGAHPYDLMQTIDQTTEFVKRLREKQVMPFAVGGDHVVPLPVLRGLHDGQPLGMLQFDSHPDTYDEFYGTRINHATPFRRAAEEGLLDPKRVVQLGLRGTQFSPDDASGSRELGFTVITYDEYEEMGREATIAKLREVLGGGPVYITYDVDGLDPRDAPGTSALEPGGLSVRDSQVILRGLRGLDVVGGDVCEVTPQLDPTGITAVNAANLMFEIVCLMANRFERASS